MAGDQTKFDPSNNPLAPRGWLCPVCGGGVAPGVTRCPCVAVASVPSVWTEPTMSITTNTRPGDRTVWVTMDDEKIEQAVKAIDRRRCRAMPPMK